jgi:hypothetical protein
MTDLWLAIHTWSPTRIHSAEANGHLEPSVTKSHRHSGYGPKNQNVAKNRKALPTFIGRAIAYMIASLLNRG